MEATSGKSEAGLAEAATFAWNTFEIDLPANASICDVDRVELCEEFRCGIAGLCGAVCACT